VRRYVPLSLTNELTTVRYTTYSRCIGTLLKSIIGAFFFFSSSQQTISPGLYEESNILLHIRNLNRGIRSTFTGMRSKNYTATSRRSLRRQNLKRTQKRLVVVLRRRCEIFSQTTNYFYAAHMANKTGKLRMVFRLVKERALTE